MTVAVTGASRRRRFRPADTFLTVWGLLGLAFLFFPIVVRMPFLSKTKLLTWGLNITCG